MKNIKIGEGKLNPSAYLYDKRINPDQAKFIFKVRTRMLSMKCNFKNQFKENYTCDLCNTDLDNQEHLLKCKVLQHFIPEILNSNINYEDMFDSVEKIIPASELLHKVCKERDQLLEIIEDSRSDK